jgi:prophage DNA circulation protein
MEAFVAELALREIGYSITGMAFDNYDQAIETRRAVGQVFIAIEQQTADAGQDDVFSALAELRHAINAMIMARAASLNPLVTYRTLITANSITLAWRMYQDTDRDLELCDRVNARNPAFLPSTGRILAAGA